MGSLQSLADRTRLRLLRLLERQELGVVELCDVLQLPQSTVSRHLKVLADQRWVKSRRSGTTHLYRTILDELEPAARKLWLLAREQTSDWATVRQDELRLTRLLNEARRAGNSQAFFAGAAGQWDKLRRDLYGESFTSAASFALLPKDWAIADLGCGTGEMSHRLAGQVRRVIGIDNSDAMLRAARKRLGELSNVELICAELGSLPLADSICNAAMLVLVLTYIADIEPVLREARRIVQPGGKLVTVDLLPHDRDDFRRMMGQQHPGFDPEDVQRWLQAAGFIDIQIQTLAPEPNAKGPALFLATGTR